VRDKRWEEGGSSVCKEAERRLGGSRWWPVGLMGFSGFFFFFLQREGCSCWLREDEREGFLGFSFCVFPLNFFPLSLEIFLPPYSQNFLHCFLKRAISTSSQQGKSIILKMTH